MEKIRTIQISVGEADYNRLCDIKGDRRNWLQFMMDAADLMVQ
jgi:hypothetical protein